VCEIAIYCHCDLVTVETVFIVVETLFCLTSLLVGLPMIQSNHDSTGH